MRFIQFSIWVFAQMIYFTADFHYNHGNIIKYCNRPFLAQQDKEALAANGGKWHNDDWKGEGASRHRISSEAISLMNDSIIDGVNKTVGINDTLYFLGDWCFGSHVVDYYRAARECRDRIRCKKIHMIWGNHDEGISNLFESCHDLFNLNVNGTPIILCHYAMAAWHKSHRGSWQLYGHSHSAMEPWMDSIMPKRRSMDVGIDNAAKLLGEYRPFSFDEIKNIFAKRSGCFVNSTGKTVEPVKGQEE